MSIPPLVLTQERATRLLGSIQAYRRLALTQRVPSQERNLWQRHLQGMQGKLLPDLERLPPGSSIALRLSREDIAALLVMVRELSLQHAREGASEQRDAMLVDLVSLKATLEKLAVSGPATRSSLTRPLGNADYKQQIAGGRER
jgi:hypothetical protein